jgi:hypothetical protein
MFQCFLGAKSKYFMKKSLIFSLLFLLSACSAVDTNSIERPIISVSIEDQDRIRFSGKGAGAGMMMSASMGAMGIAIGVAIDEGIAKEIHESFVTSGGDFSEIIKSETHAWLIEVCGSSDQTLNHLCHTDTELNIMVYHYGVETTSGENDPVKAKLEIGLVQGGQEELRLDLKGLDDQPKVPLDLIKKDGKLAIELLVESYAVLLKNYENRIKNTNL